MPDNSEVTSAPEEVEVEECSTCEQAMDDCTCWTCSACDVRFDPDHDNSCGSCELCDSCCTCWSCQSCDTQYQPYSSRTGRGESACSNCEYCSNCCECMSCENCGERRSGENICAECNSCSGDCCSCSNVRFHEPARPTFHTVKAKGKVNPIRRVIAAEIEVGEGFDDDVYRAVVTNWRGGIVEDGSSGVLYEINTAPAGGDKFVQQITNICAALAGAGAGVNNGCGLHIHVDARDFTYADVRRLMLLYAKVEEAMFDIVATSRIRNSFTRPCGPRYLDGLKDNKLWGSGKMRAKVRENVYGHGGFTRTTREAKYNQSRYNAMNLHSWFYRGTVEFRHHHGTVSASKIINWGLLCGGLVEFAHGHTERQIDALPASSLMALCKVAPTTAVRAWVIERFRRFNPGATLTPAETQLTFGI